MLDSALAFLVYVDLEAIWMCRCMPGGFDHVNLQFLSGFHVISRDSQQRWFHFGVLNEDGSSLFLEH